MPSDDPDGTGGDIRSRFMARLRSLPVEPRVILALGTLAGLVLLLADIVEDVTEKETGAFDKAILLHLRTSGDLSTPIGPHWLAGSMSDITSLGSTTVITLVTVMAVAYLLVLGRKTTASMVAASVISGAIVEKTAKWGFDRARPDVVPHLVQVHTLSFPSGHAMLSAVAYLTLGALLARAQTQWRARIFVVAAGVALTVLIGFSRVYLGVHWPTDVLAGWTAGSIWALVFWMIADRMGRPAAAAKE